MLQNILVTALIFLFTGMFALVFGQTPAVAIKPSIVVGDVVTVGDNKFTVTTQTGPVEIVITDKSIFKRISADNPNLTTATPGSSTDISIGDKLTVTGILAADGKAIPARAVYFMTKADIDAKSAKESGEWKTRGITGKVVSVNTQTNQINVETRTLTGTSTVTLTPKADAKFLRYAPDSVRFNEAVLSSLLDIKTGDMMRAVGDRSTDGVSFAAEQVITGAFQTVAGTVKSIDIAKNEVVITNLETKKEITVVIGETSILKRFPAEQAEMLARMQMMGAGGARPMGQVGGRPGGQVQTPGGGRPGMGGARANGGIEDILDRSPSITAGDLKTGDIIALSSTKSTNMDRIKAIKLFAGVEPFLRAAQATGRGRRGQGGVASGFTIPGLDGIEGP